MPKPTKPSVSQFAGLKSLSDKTRAKLMDNPDAPGEIPPPPIPESSATEEPPVKRTHKRRKPGKVSNPDWTPTTLLMRKETKSNVRIQLERMSNRGEDLSDLVDKLLIKWLRNPYAK